MRASLRTEQFISQSHPNEYNAPAMRAFSAEEQFVLRCCAAGHHEGETAALKALLDKINWRQVIELALAEGVMPLVYRYAIDKFSDLLPRQAARELRFHFQEVSLRSRLLTRELLRLVSILEHNGIHPVAFKGPALASLAYGDFAMRQFSDLDLLVQPGELEPTLSVLAADGFVSDLLDPAIITAPFFQASKVVLMKPGSGIVLDLHWRLMPRYFPFAPECEAVCGRAVRLRVADGEVSTLAPPDQMLVTCVHAARHGWEWLGMVADVAALLLVENSNNWAALRDEAEQLGALPHLLIGLMLAHEALAAPVPDIMIDLAQRSGISRLAANLVDLIFVAPSWRISLFRDWVVPLQTIEKSWARFTYVAARAFAPTFDDWTFAPLPTKLFPLYYLLRPVRIAIQKAAPLRSILFHPTSGEPLQ
jgi:hypothetical protein